MFTFFLFTFPRLFQFILYLSLTQTVWVRVGPWVCARTQRGLTKPSGLAQNARMNLKPARFDLAGFEPSSLAPTRQETKRLARFDGRKPRRLFAFASCEARGAPRRLRFVPFGVPYCPKLVSQGKREQKHGFACLGQYKRRSACAQRRLRFCEPLCAKRRCAWLEINLVGCLAKPRASRTTAALAFARAQAKSNRAGSLHATVALTRTQTV